MSDVLSYALVGACVSLVVQLIKSTVGTDSWKTVAVTVGVSLIGGAFYYQFANTAYWQAFLGVLASANAVYGFIIHQLE